VQGLAGQPLTFSDRLDVAQAEDVFKLGASNTFRLALEYRHDSDSTSPITGAEVFYDVISASGMWNWQLSPLLTLTNALRLDDLALGRDGYTPPGYPLTNHDWDRQLHVPSFNSGLVWRLDDSDTLRLMAARGTLLPNLVELGALLYQTPGFGVTGTPTLAPTRVDSYELDWDRSVPQLQGELRTAVFYQFTDGMTVLDGGVLAGPAGFYVTPEISATRARSAPQSRSTAGSPSTGDGAHTCAMNGCGKASAPRPPAVSVRLIRRMRRRAAWPNSTLAGTRVGGRAMPTCNINHASQGWRTTAWSRAR
jgi:hypothetical protein